MNEAEVAKVRDDDIVLLEKSLAILYKEIGPPIDRELDR